VLSINNGVPTAVEMLGWRRRIVKVPSVEGTRGCLKLEKAIRGARLA